MFNILMSRGWPKNWRTVCRDDMRTFIAIWFGQLVSLTGSSITAFALGVWVYQTRGSVTDYSLISLSAIVPFVVVSPLAGAVADRWNRRTVMIVADFFAGLCTLAIAVFFYHGSLGVIHICVLNALNSTFSAFQYPAFTAAITLLVPRRHLAKASGLTQAGRAVTRLMLAPIMAGALLVTIGLWGILVIDFLTFMIAFVILLFVKIPHHSSLTRSGVGTHPGTSEKPVKKTLAGDAVQGWSYIIHRPGLLGLLMFFAAGNFFLGLAYVLFTPLILTFASAAALGAVVSIGGAGMLTGGVSMGVWGDKANLMQVMFAFSFLIGICVLSAGLHDNLWMLGAAVFFYFFGKTIIGGCVQVLIQKTVEKDLQGRVFSMIGAIAAAALPLAYAAAGPLADHVFTPSAISESLILQPLSGFIGTGEGAGIRLMFLIIGISVILVTIAAMAAPSLRRLET